MNFSSPFETLDKERENALTKSVLLPRWTAKNWDRLLEYTETQLASPGDTVLHARSEKRALYIVALGKLQVLANQPKKKIMSWTSFRKPIAPIIVEQGAVLGELSFLDGGPYSVTVQAITDCQLQYLSFDAFTLFCNGHPELASEVLFDLGRIVSLQMRHIIALLAQ